MKVLASCLVLSVLVLSQAHARAMDYRHLSGDYADYTWNNPQKGLSLKRRLWPDYPLLPNSLSELPVQTKRAQHGYYLGAASGSASPYRSRGGYLDTRACQPTILREARYSLNNLDYSHCKYYKRSSLNELIQRLLAMRGDSRETGRANMMRFGAGRR